MWLGWFEAGELGDGAAAAALTKITLRAALAALLSFGLALAWGPRLISWLQRHFREPNVSPSPRLQQLHAAKAWTPTMGGLFLIAGILGGTCLFGDLTNPFVQLALLLTVSLGLLGAVDDLAKLRTGRRGMSARRKLAAQIVLAGVVALLAYRLHAPLPGGLDLRLPGVETAWPLGFWFVPLAMLVIVSSSNAVNLTDGLDGLAGGCLIFATAGMGLVAYAAGHASLAEYLQVAHVAGAGEMLIVVGGMIGGLLGFLWFNCHPAQVFMGDTGSLPLGGLLGWLAIVARQELLLVVIGGVFVVEAASVILQVGCFRWTGRRLFRCAPLHHHFQFQGWPESQIVVRFWIAGALCALLGLASAKGTLAEKPTPAAVPALTARP